MSRKSKEEAKKQAKKQGYILQRNKFEKTKNYFSGEISRYKILISSLEKAIDNERPRTENGRFLCERCDCISLKYVGRTPQGGCAGGDDIYECEICGWDNLYDY